MRNPPWSRDELLVALDFYLTHRPSIPGKETDEVGELSDILQRLRGRMEGDVSETFRNRNGVYMKLMNFRRFDPDYSGSGLKRGNKDEEVVWNLYSNKPNDLREIVSTLRKWSDSNDPVPESFAVDDEEEEAEEGAILTRTHRARERSGKLSQKKKASVLKEFGKLACEVCGFDFSLSYGERGNGFIECHHVKPVSELTPGSKTKLNDLVLVCSNCHRMIHRQRPWLSVDALRLLIQNSSS